MVRKIGRPLGTGGVPMSEEQRAKIKAGLAADPEKTRAAHERAMDTRRGRRLPYWMTLRKTRVKLDDDVQAWLKTKECVRCHEPELILRSINDEKKEGAVRCQSCFMLYQWRREGKEFILWYRRRMRSDEVMPV